MIYEQYVTGAGQILGVHKKGKCEHLDACPIHSPSPHHMREWPTYWHSAMNIMMRTCPHGVSHPDPDDSRFNYTYQTMYEGKYEHGCDGCCCESVTEKKQLDEEYID